METMTSKLKQLETVLLDSWWVILFSFCAYLAYTYALQGWEGEYRSLGARALSLREALEAEEKRRKGLKLLLNSQSDPAYVEMVLMQKLGMVPSGQTKFYLP